MNGSIANGRILFEIAVNAWLFIVHQARQQLNASCAAPLKRQMRVPLKSAFGTKRTL